MLISNQEFSSECLCTISERKKKRKKEEDYLLTQQTIFRLFFFWSSAQVFTMLCKSTISTQKCKVNLKQLLGKEQYGLEMLLFIYQFECCYQTKNVLPWIFISSLPPENEHILEIKFPTYTYYLNLLTNFHSQCLYPSTVWVRTVYMLLCALHQFCCSASMLGAKSFIVVWVFWQCL